MTSELLKTDMVALIKTFGDAGVFLAMFLESSIIPIPSEAIVVSAGAIGIPLASIVIFGALGSTLGGMFGYFLGRYAAMPAILRFGKFILIKPHHIQKAEEFAKKYGIWSVLIGRVLPIVPFKVFSIAAGITKVPFVPFMICTLAGVLPRMYILALLGFAVIKYTKVSLQILLLVAVIFIAVKVTHKFYNEKKPGKKNYGP